VSGLVRACAAVTCILGLGLGGFGVWSGARGTFPMALVIALILCGALLVGLGIGLNRRARAAWSFTVAILGVLAVTGLMAIPALVRGGLPTVVAGFILAGVFGLLGSLIVGREAF
jgi:hypothetical protein